MYDIISQLIELKSQARIAQELMVNSDFQGPDWKRLTVALESVDKINRIMDEIMNTVESDSMVEERVQQIKRYQRMPFVADLMAGIWDEGKNTVSEEAI
ncbi:MAG: hypothetical protein JW825_01440 [Candidatus Methanofastidiosa archaeon]|nr:hypothetical protein [Candidatus Methanofastidiosa archaeon]